MLVLFGVLSVLARGTTRSSMTALRIYAVGVIAAIACDLAYGHLAAHSAYRAGDPVDTLAMLSVIAILLSLACQLRAGLPGDRHGVRGGLQASLVPALPRRRGKLPAPGHRGQARHQGRLPRIVLLGAIALTSLVCARQYIATRDYGRLAVRYQELAAIDGMTGLYNRRHFMETAQAAVAHARPAGQPLVALMIDVDNFKQVNDMHGHVVGDQVLIELARACRENAAPVTSRAATGATSSPS